MSDNTPENPPFIIPNPDGSYTRLVTYPSSLRDQDSDDAPVFTKDLTVNHTNKTGVRIHIPKALTLVATPPVQKLPLVVYYHGGGFVVSTVATTLSHEFCNHLAARLPAVVVNVNYRLAPEHRLPAAYDDGVEVLGWIKSTHDPWLTNFADFSDCYLMGTSAGANLAYHVGLRVLLSQPHIIHDLEPMKIKGLILHSLFIGGVERVASETWPVTLGSRFTLAISDMMWESALPVGASRDHEYCNLMMGGSVDGMVRIKESGWRVMVTCRYGDLMIDRQTEFTKALELKGVECECFYGDGEHGIELFDESKAEELSEKISSFVSSVKAFDSINRCEDSTTGL